MNYLTRDKYSKAVINGDAELYARSRIEAARSRENLKLKEEVKDLKEELSEIKQLLKKLVDGSNNNG